MLFATAERHTFPWFQTIGLAEQDTVGAIRASMQCTVCSAGVLGDERHIITEGAPLAAPQAEFADLSMATPMPVFLVLRRATT